MTTVPPGTTRTALDRRDRRAAVVTAALLLLLAGPVGAVWALVAPRERVAAGGPAAGFTGAGGDLFVGADLAFLAVTAAVGLLCGAVAVRAVPAAGWPVAVALAAGGLAAAALAAEVGTVLGAAPLVYDGGQLRPGGGSPLPASAATVVDVSLRLRSPAFLVAWPVTALLVHLLHQLTPATAPAGPAPSGGPAGLSSG